MSENIKKFKILLSLCTFFGFLVGCASNEIIYVHDSPYPISTDSFVAETIVSGFAIPYGLAIVSDDEYFVTDRVGRLFHFKKNNLTEIEGTPRVNKHPDPGLPIILHGGLMDVSLHPNYSSNGLLYLAYLDEDNFAKVSRFQIQDKRISNLETIFKTNIGLIVGNGMRIEWQNENQFFLNVGGSVFSTASNPILFAQYLDVKWSKIHRLNDDGSVPKDNPIFEDQSSPTTIWSYGHRDVQGLHYDKSTETLYGVEHGPKGGDEFNVINKGGNYGWPLFTYGIHYDGNPVSTITEEQAAKMTILPEHYWTVPTDNGGRSIAPSTLLKVDNSNVQDWNDYFLVGSLAFRRLMKYNHKTHETFGLDIEGRVRTVKQLPGGDIIILVERSNIGESNGKIVRIKNKLTAQ